MGDDVRTQTMVATLRSGARLRVVGAGGVGKTHLLAVLDAELRGAPVIRWNAGIEPDRLPHDGHVALVDDAHLATPRCRQALARHTGGLVATHRPARRDVAEQLDALDGSPTVLGPLPDDAIAELLTRRWGIAPDPAIVRGIAAATGGLARLVMALVGHQPIAAVRRTATLDELVRSERERLRPGARRLLDAAAIVGALDLSLLAAAADLSLDDATAAAAHLAGVGLALDASVRLPTAVADAVRFLAPAPEVTAIVERAAAAAVDSGEHLDDIADRLHDTGVAGPATARCLLAAARASYGTDPDRAARWITAAGRHRGSSVDVAALRALVGFRRGRPEETIAAVDELLRAEAPLERCPLRRDAIEIGAAVLASRGAWARGAELAEAVGAAGESAVAIAATARLAVGHAAAVRATAEACDGAAQPGLRSAASATLARGLAATLDDDPAPALPTLLQAARLYELATPAAPLPESPHALAAVVACHLWEFDVAEQILADDPGGDPAHRPRHALLRAWAALRRAALDVAADHLAHARTGGLEDVRDQLLALAVDAGIARRHSDLDGMDRAWRAARPLLLGQVPDVLTSQPVGELLIVGARLGERATVHSCLVAMRDLVVAAGRPPLWTLSLEWDALHIGIASGDTAAASAAAERARRLPVGAGRVGVVVAAAQCWAHLLQGELDGERIRAVAADLAAVGLGHEAARLAGAAAIRATDSASMRGLLQLARDLQTDRAAPDTTASMAVLTPREVDVARHLVTGLTYREIGLQLYLAPKTIEHHVARIRRKLGAGSRAELLVAVRRQLSASAA